MLTLIMLINHTISDFIFQTSDDVSNKSNMKLKGYLKHFLYLLLTSIPVLLIIKNNNIMKVISTILLIIFIHLILDFIKENLQNYYKSRKLASIINILLFTFDQLMHIIVIIILTSKISIEFNLINKFFLEFLFVNGGFSYQDLKYIFIILYISFSGAYFVPLLFNIVYSNVDGYTKVLNYMIAEEYDEKYHVFLNEVKAGKWIGILERILIVGLLHLNQLSSIGFIIAIKSLARFKMMENKIFSEYYLLGTLFSVVYTFISYLFLNKIL